jgi:hypothetical protein
MRNTEEMKDPFVPKTLFNYAYGSRENKQKKRLRYHLKSRSFGLILSPLVRTAPVVRRSFSNRTWQRKEPKQQIVTQYAM